MLMALVYFVLPAVLLIIGFPIYAILLITSICAIYFVTDVPLTTIQTTLFKQLPGFLLGSLGGDFADYIFWVSPVLPVFFCR